MQKKREQETKRKSRFMCPWKQESVHASTSSHKRGIYQLAVAVALFPLFPALARSVSPVPHSPPPVPAVAFAKSTASPKVQVAQSSGSLASLELVHGRNYYEAGQFAAAARAWKQAAAGFATQGDRLNQAMALSNLSLAYQQIGQWPQATAANDASLKLLQNGQASGNGQDRVRVIAQALNTQGSLQLALGQSEQALSTWQSAAHHYSQAKDQVGITRSLINQAQAFKALGLYRRALTSLTQVNEILQKEPDSLMKTAALRSLGTTLQLVGDAEQSKSVLQQSLDLAQKLKSSADVSAALLSLGNTARTQDEDKAALEFYEQAASSSPSSTVGVQAKLNQLSLLLEQNQVTTAQALWPQIESEINQLPSSRTTVYAQINFAQSLMKLEDRNTEEGNRGIAQILAKAVQEAKSLGDQRALAYALGNLGKLYEQNQQWSNAQDLTQQALLITQAINAPDIAYNWQWQLGRLLLAQGNTSGAIASYTEAVNTLQSLRRDLVAVNPDVQFSFRDSVEPVYRELVSLLLRPDGEKTTQKNLVQARDVIESLQLAELDNFFQEACLDTKPVQVDQVNPQAGVIYPIILADRLEVILSLPGQPLRHYSTSKSQADVESTAEKLRKTLVIRSKREFTTFSQQLYDWLIRPAEADLAKSGVDTLVFVLDGALRNIPMAALHDNKQYLVEKYNIALAPGLQLIDPKPLQKQQMKALTAGLSKARQGFAPLENVAQEVKQIKSEVPSVVLLDQSFTSNSFQDELGIAHFPIVHIATHGQFSSKAEKTFILTWDGRINVKVLDDILQPKGNSKLGTIELLVLSACETAEGDKRAALGLAGIAVRAGARSTLATLWSVNDAATTDLMGRFYRELVNSKLTKAAALRQAQLALIQNPSYQHPIYWAPYVLVGNWL